MTGRGPALRALHYALASVCIALAALLHLSPAGPLLHPTGLFVLGVIAAAWFGGVGPGFFAALLATLVLPQLIEINYPLTAGWLDLPRFVTFTITGLAVGWGTTLRRGADAMAKSNAALQRSEERYAIAMSSAEEGFWDWDLATHEFHASPRMLEMCGFERDAVFTSRPDFLARFPFAPGERERWQAAVDAHFAGKSARLDMEIRILRGGETRWLYTTGMATRSTSGAVVRWTGATRDITARKAMEEALRHSEERYAVVMNASEEGFWDWEVATDEFYCSPRMLEMYGFPRDTRFASRAEFIERFAFHPEDRPKWEQAIAAHFAGKSARFDIEIRMRRNGETRWIHLTGLAARDASGAVVRWTGATRDVTARRAAEAALRESKQRYERALEASNDGLWEWDPTTDEMFVSPRARQLFGIRDDVPIGTRADVRAHGGFHPEDRSRIDDTIRASLEQGGGIDMEYRVIDGAGELRWVRSRGKVFVDGAGAAALVTGSLTDITERKNAELALRQSEERYARAMLAAEAGFWDWDVAQDEFYVSPRLLEMGGFAPGTTFESREEFMRRASFHPDDLDTWNRAVAGLFAGSGSRLAMEVRVTVNGESRWHKLDGMCFRDAAGKVVRWTGSTTDVTARKAAEHALRLSEERYAIAMQASGAGHWDWKISTDEYHVSPRHLELAGIEPDAKWTSRAEYVARLPFAPGERARWEAAVAAHFAGKTVHFDMEVRIVPHGEPRWVQMIGMCIRDEAGRPMRWAGSMIDITDRKRAELALRASEERYARAMEGSDAGHWDWNLVTDEMFVSERAREMLALPAGPLPATRNEIMTLSPMHPDDRASMHEQVAASIAAGSHERDYRVIPRPGELRWLRSRGKIFRNERGTAVRMTGSLTDITERKLAAEALGLSEQRYARAMDAAEAGHWEWNVATDEMFVSARQREMLELPAELLFARREDYLARIPFHPDDRDLYLAAAQRHIAEAWPRFEQEFRIVLKGGETRWMRLTGKAHRDAEGRPSHFTGSLIDITERHKVEDDLRSRQEMLELAQKSARAIAFEWKIGVGEGENRWSPDLEAMYGFAPGTYDGSFEMWKKLVHREDWPAVEEAIKHAQSTGEVAAEYRVVHPDGSVHWLQARGRMFFDAAGIATRMVGFMQDVTQRKHAEEEMRKLEQELRRAQRLEAMGTLAGGIAHDFNNILGAILGYGEMALRDAKKGSRLRRDLDSIMSAGERGRALIDRILAFSRSGVGERVAVHVEVVVREALDQLAANLPESVTIAPRLHAGRAAMLGDSTQVHQVVMNLAANAVQAMPHGGVLRLALEVMRFESPRALTVGSIAAGDYIVLTVTDSGTGITADVLERMFDPFFTTKELGVGTGLGLSLVHGIVANVGGAIEVRTELGKGSTFTVYLPRCGDAAPKAAGARRSLPRGDGQRVLVVDDEEPLVRLATETLEGLGYAAVGFTSSTAALAAFRADPRRFDAVLTDERMPEMSGTALIREVRGIRESIPVVLMSGYLGATGNAPRENALLDALGVAPRVAVGVGADVVVKKPLSARDLAASMARALQH